MDRIKLAFKNSFDVGCHQVAHRAAQQGPSCVDLREDVSDRILEGYTYIIRTAGMDLQGPTFDIKVVTYATGVPDRHAWAILVCPDQGEIPFTEDSFVCVAVVASTSLPSDIGALALLKTRIVQCPEDWKGMFCDAEEETISTESPVMVLTESTLPQHMLAALRVFLLGRTKLHERWSDAINAWVKMEGRPPIMYPTVKESEKGVMPRIASFADDSSKCTVCRTQQACDHWYSRIMERLVGHHLDIVFPISFSFWSTETPLSTLHVPPGLLTSPHVYSPQDCPGIPHFAPTIDNVKGFEAEIHFYRAVEAWGRLAGIVCIRMPQEATIEHRIRLLEAPKGPRRKGKTPSKVTCPATMQRIVARWDGVYEIPTALTEVPRSRQPDVNIVHWLKVLANTGNGPGGSAVEDSSSASAGDPVGEGYVDIGAPDTTAFADFDVNEAMHAAFAAAASETQQGRYISDIQDEQDRIRVYSSDSPRPFNQYNLAGDWASCSPRYGLNRPFYYIGAAQTWFAIHPEDFDSYSFNEHLAGAPKIWMSTASSYTPALIYAIEQRANNGSQCAHSTRHKDRIVTPAFLAQQGIPFHTVAQRVGDLVMTFPSAHHQGFNSDRNLNIAVNYVRGAWVPDGIRARKCDCGRRDKECESWFSYMVGREDTEELLCWKNNDFESAVQQRANQRFTARQRPTPCDS